MGFFYPKGASAQLSGGGSLSLGSYDPETGAVRLACAGSGVAELTFVGSASNPTLLVPAGSVDVVRIPQGATSISANIVSGSPYPSVAVGEIV